MRSADHQEAFERGLALFNTQDFFECHEVLEEVWMEETGGDRLFYQGLIQVAVGFYHLLGDNYIGAEHLLTKGIDKLSRYGDRHRGVELAGFLERTGVCLEQVRAVRQGARTGVDLGLIPQIEYGAVEVL